MKLRYRNTGFIRQFYFYRNGHFRMVELGKYYIRYYKRTPEGVMPKYKEIRL